MKKLRFVFLLMVGSLLFSSNVAAGGNHEFSCENADRYIERLRNSDYDPQKIRYIIYKIKERCGRDRPPRRVPEIDAAGGVVATGLLAGLFGLVRERKSRV